MNEVQQPVMRQGSLSIVEPPLSTGERMSVNDPVPVTCCARKRTPNRPAGVKDSRVSRHRAP